MRKNSILLIAFCSIMYITLSSDIDGAAHHGHGDVTGARTGTLGHCQTSSCHGGNNANTVVTLQVLDTTTMAPISTYSPGQTYLVSLKGDATAVTHSLPGFGFMVSAVSGAHVLSGSYTIPAATASYIHSYPCGTTTVVEQTVTLAPDSTGVNKYSIQFYWTAPTATGSDSVSFYSLLNAVNNDRGSGGDYPNAGAIVTIYQDTTTTQINNIPAAAAPSLSLYPNPASDQITVKSASQISAISVVDQTGKTVLSRANNATTAHLDISALPAGIYCVQVNGGVSGRFTKK